ncbi:26S proteasome regulatory subunit, putative [Giardia lamblia P15]|uniref:26S proteasome regulatory subunit, putative n=1 Tax=Giardia intestinalis (strain P15) TaxID=658858 RepID=E1EXF7_GIAIA|nr:26S proteasome regulatory subunit, putative [Giardia lamblia P15]
MASAALALLHTPGFSTNEEAIRLVQEQIETIHYQVDMGTIIDLCRVALQTKAPSLCLLLSRFYHAESRIGLAAFFALLPDPVMLSLTGSDLYSQEIITSIVDFYISYRSGLVAGSLASIKYTEDSTTGNLRQVSQPHGSSSINCSAHGSSVIFGKQSATDLLASRQSVHSVNKNTTLFGLNQSGSVLLDDQSRAGAAGCSSSTLIGKSVVGHSSRADRSRTRVLTDDEFVKMYIISKPTTTYQELCAVGNPDSIVFSELLHIDLNKITTIIDAIIEGSKMHSKLSFLLQTQHIEPTRKAENVIIDLSYLQIPGTLSPQPADVQTNTENDPDIPRLSELTSVTATPFIRQLPLDTLRVMEKDAHLIPDSAFCSSILCAVGDEYKRRCLFEDAARCYAQNSNLEPLATLFLDIIKLISEPSSATSTVSVPVSESTVRNVLIFHAIQLAFQVFQDLPGAMLDNLISMLKEESIPTPFGSAFLGSLKKHILTGNCQSSLYKTVFADKTNLRIDRNVLLKIQQNIHKSSSDSFIIATAFFMASLMHAQLGHSLQSTKDSSINLSTWDKFGRVSYDGIIFRGAAAPGDVSVYDRYYSAMKAGNLTTDIDGYACGGMFLGLGIMTSEMPSVDGFSSYTLLNAAEPILSNPGRYMLLFDENGVLAPRPSMSVQGYEAFVFGYAISAGLMCLGTGSEKFTTRLKSLLASPAAFHPDAIYGILFGLGLIHLGDPLFLKAFNFNEFYISKFGMGMTTSKTTITVTDEPPKLYTDLAATILEFLVSKHEKVRTGAAICIALCCYCIDAQANQAIEFLLDFEPRIQTSHLTSNKLCDGIQKAGPIALGLAYAHTNSLEVATQLVSIASRSTVDEVSYHGLVMIAFVLSSQRGFANELLILAAKSHRVACRQGAALALGYINAGTWDPVVVKELRDLMSDQVEAVRAHAIIAQALVLQTCSAPTLPEKIKIESDAPLGDRQKNVIYKQDHDPVFIRKVVALNKLRHIPGRIQDRSREFAAFETSLTAKSENIPSQENVDSEQDTAKKEKRSKQHLSEANDAARKLFNDKANTDTGIIQSREFAKKVEEQLERGFTLEDYCSQFRADLLGSFTEHNFIDLFATDLGLRACAIALGLLNCGGMNSSFSILTPAGLPKTTATIGALLFAESHMWHPFSPCIAMCLARDICITVTPSVDEAGQLTMEIAEGILLVDKAYDYPYPDLSVERTATMWDRYVKNAKLSLGTARRHVNEMDTEGTETSNFSYVRKASRTATQRFLHEAMSANLGDVVVDDTVKKESEQKLYSNEGAYSILQTPCRILKRQVEHVLIPENSDLIPISSISQGIVVMCEIVDL